MLRFFVSIVVFNLMIASAMAETDWTSYGSFASTRCEDAKTIADIKESIKGLSFNDGSGATFANAGNVTIVSSTTVRAASDTLVCKLRMQTREDGQTQIYSARHTVKLYPDGRWTTQYQPNY